MSRRTDSSRYGIAPNARTSPPGSATATMIFSESTSHPTYRISFIGRLLSLVALRYGQPIASVTYELAIGAGRPIVTNATPGAGLRPSRGCPRVSDLTRRRLVIPWHPDSPT